MSLAWACLFFSNRITASARREAASKPKAPVPANKSRQLKPSKSRPSQLNIVSRTRSVLGRRPGKSITPSKRLRQTPPIIRIFWGGSECLPFFTGLFIFWLLKPQSSSDPLLSIFEKPTALAPSSRPPLAWSKYPSY